MKKKIQKTIAAVLCVAIILSFSPIIGFLGIGFDDSFTTRAGALAATGKCGENVSYTFNSETGVLLLTGSGDMYNYTINDHSPFYQTDTIKYVVIDEGITNIGEYVFYYCNGIQSVILPSTLVSIGESAFAICKNITNISIPEGVNSIAFDAFFNCDKLSVIVISSTVNSIHYYAFRNCDSLTDIMVSSKNSTYCSVDGILYSKDKTHLVQCPKGKKGIIENIPDTVLAIDEKAFYECDKITEIVLPDSVTLIGSYAFNYCKSITTFNIPCNVESIGSYAFDNTDCLTFISVDNNNQNFCNDEFGALYNKLRTSLIKYPVASSNKMFSLPDSVNRIESEAFCNAKNLESIVLPSSLSYVGYNAFYKCNNLKNITIPDSTISLDYSMFEDCTNVADLTLPGSLFVSCTKSKSSPFSEKIQKLMITAGTGTMYNYNESTYKQTPWCISGNNLENVSLEEGINHIGDYYFCNCSKLKNINIVNTVTSIGAHAFDGCESLSLITILDNVVDVDDTAFLNCSPSLIIVGLEGSYIQDYCRKNNITFYPMKITSLKITSYPDKMKYFVGDQIDLSGLTMEACYDNGINMEVMSDFSCSVEKFSDEGSQMVTLNYHDATVSYIVSVSPIIACSLDICTMPNKTSYYIEDELDLTGLKMSLTYNNGEIKEIQDGYTISTVDMSSPGEKTVKISYQGFEAQFSITINDVFPVTVQVISYPQKTAYYVGDKIDFSGLEVEISYNNGTKETVTSGFACVPNTVSKSGNQDIIVSCNGTTVSFGIEAYDIIPTNLLIKKVPSISRYYINDDLSTSGLSLTVKYNNGSEKEIIDLSKVNFTYDFSSIGQKVVNMSYDENGVTLSNSFNVTVHEKSELYSKTISCYSGDIIAVPIYVSNNNGLMGFRISLDYNPSVFTPASVIGGDMLGINPDGTQMISILENNIEANPNGTLDVIWSSTENILNNGLLFTVYFTVDNTANGNYNITVDYDPETTFDEDENLVKFDCSGVTVSVEYNEPSDPTIKIDSVSAKPGQTISIPVKAVNIPEMDNEFEINVLFDKTIYSSIEIDSEISENFSVNYNKRNGIRVTFDYLPAITKDSTLFTINLTISDSANGEYQFELDADDFLLENGTVTILPNTTSIYADDVTIESVGQIISVPVYIKDNHGIMGYGIDVSYDTDYLSLVSIVNGTAFNQGLFDNNVFPEESYANVIWSHSDNISNNGLLFTLNFRVENLPEKNTVVRISYNQDDTFNSEWEDVVLECNDFKVKVIGNDIIFAKAGSGSVVDDGFIYGLNAGIQSIDNYVEVAEGYELDYTGTSIIGTGTVINAVKDSEACEHCIVVIFGDVNGDGVYDGTDAIIVNCIANGMLTKEQVGEAVYMAADCNHDGVIDNLDVELLQQAGVLLASVGQNKTQEELQTSSAYTEYLNLIDQNPVNEDKESYTESESTPSNSNQILDFLLDIIAFIKSLINFIKTVFA